LGFLCLRLGREKTGAESGDSLSINGQGFTSLYICIQEIHNLKEQVNNLKNELNEANTKAECEVKSRDGKSLYMVAFIIWDTCGFHNNEFEDYILT
jgi:hypothetical protein